MTSPRSPQPDPLREALSRIKTLALNGDMLVHIAEVADEALRSTPSPDTDLRATLLREIVEAIGDRTFVLDSNEYGQRVVQFGRGESVSSATGKPLGPGQMAVNGGDVEDPLVSALARAVELLGPDRVTVR